MQKANENVENWHVNLSVFSYRPDKSGSSTILYSVSITTRSNTTWVVEKRFLRKKKIKKIRYSQFEKLQEELRKYFGDTLPQLPKKTKTHDDIEQRRVGLDTYLKSIVVRQEVFNSPPLREFLEIDAHYIEAVVNPPEVILEIGQFLHGVRDFQIDYHQSVMFVINSDTNLFTRLDAYMTNMKMPWESEQSGSGQMVIPVGCVECWIHNEKGNFERAWTKMYNSQAISLYWDAQDCVCFVGLDSGNINMLKVPQLETNFKRFDESTEIEQHLGRVMGIYYDPVFKVLHSVSKDKRYRVLDLKKQVLIADYEAGNFELTYLLIDQTRKQSLVGDKCGSVYVYDISKPKPQALVHLETTVRSVRGLYFDAFRSLLFILGHEEGDLVVFDMNKPGRESEAREVGRFQNKSKCREVCWSGSRGEVYVGNQDGTVTIWDMKKKQQIYVIKAHDSPITKMVWFEDDISLLTGSKDKVIKVWKMPKSWRDKKSVDEEEKQTIIQAKTESMVQLQQQQRKDSGDGGDELSSWHQ